MGRKEINNKMTFLFMLTCILGAVIKIAVLGLDDSKCIQNAMLIGQSISNEKSSSWKDCQEKCVDNSACEDWTFDKKTNMCALFNDPDEIKETTNMISGPKVCPEMANSTMPSDRSKYELAAAAVAAGAQLLTATAGDAEVYKFPGGDYVKIGPGNCWRDGGGACPNGNCLDSNGRQGYELITELFKCRWFCVHIPQCRHVTCCEVIRNPEKYIPDMRVSGSSSVRASQSSKFGVYKATSEKFGGKPVWKHESNYNKIFFSTYNAWRIGTPPRSGGISAYDNTHGAFPSDISNKYSFWNGQKWIYDTSITIQAIGRRSDFDRMDNEEDTEAADEDIGSRSVIDTNENDSEERAAAI